MVLGSLHLGVSNIAGTSAHTKDIVSGTKSRYEALKNDHERAGNLRDMASCKCQTPSCRPPEKQRLWSGTQLHSSSHGPGQRDKEGDDCLPARGSIKERIWKTT
jgi:hypothetical protein